MVLLNVNEYTQVWNYDTLDLLHIVGLDEFANSVMAVSLSGGEEEMMVAAVDDSQSPEMMVWTDLGTGQEPRRVAKTGAASHRVTSLAFFPDASRLVSAGHGHLALWELDDGEEDGIKKTQGLFTRKIDRPREITCVAFADTPQNAEGEETVVEQVVLTGDSDGNVMVWKGNKVVKSLS